MKAYAIGHLTNVRMNEEILRYLQQIDSTLAPYQGHFIVHGATPDIKEGEWTGDLIIIEFPNQLKANSWFESTAYQNIASLRANNSEGTIMIVEGVDLDHKATDILQSL